MKVGYIFAMLFSALLLQGCVGAVVVGSAAVATKPPRIHVPSVHR